ncbi:MAG: rfbG [Betaproteobacteria bacterium]|nr:rfbG [Betaproteobacteria bacterium]
MGQRHGTLESVVTDAGFWRAKRVFVTGHTGFKGSWLSCWLQGLGAHMTGYSLPPPTTPSLFEGARIEKGMASIAGDVREFEPLRAALAESCPEVVFHLAAQSLVRESYDHPRETYETNVMGTVNLLEAVRHAGGVKAVVIVTSDKCYENREWVWGYREDEPLGGHDPYSSSKACAELVTSAYRSSFLTEGIAVASARAGNVIGGGDWAKDRLIPDMMRAAAAKTPLRLRNPKAVRPWQHVLDPLSGYLLLAERLCREGNVYGGAWNFGPRDEDAKPVEWIAREIAASRRGLRWEIDPSAHPHEAHYLKLDCSKARSLLGWAARLNLGDALSWTAQWYAAYDEGRDAGTLVREQINQYAGLLQA